MTELNYERPIIFVHYGNMDYLQYTFKAARLFNPNKRIVLLGDETNKHVAKKAGIEYYSYNDYNNSPEIEIFEKVYQHVAGESHGREFWTKFVFKRWFYVHNFLKINKINGLWHFDSDNLIFTDLSKQECKFKPYDCTEQCNGSCMNGFISNFSVVDNYVKTINLLFQDVNYLNEQRKDFVIHPEFAFTEMRAYLEYKRRKNLKTIRLNSIINNETFDDGICFKNEMEVYKDEIWGYHLKKLYFSGDGTIFCKHEKSGQLIKMNSLNMSWVPTYLYKDILNQAKKLLLNNNKKKTQKLSLYNIEKVQKVPLHIYLKHLFSDRLIMKLSKIKHEIIKIK